MLDLNLSRRTPSNKASLKKNGKFKTEQPYWLFQISQLIFTLAPSKVQWTDLTKQAKVAKRIKVQANGALFECTALSTELHHQALFHCGTFLQSTCTLVY